MEIHNREDHELIKIIFVKQKENPGKGDWTELVKIYLELLGLSEDTLERMDKASAKKEIKEKTKILAFKD